MSPGSSHSVGRRLLQRLCVTRMCNEVPWDGTWESIRAVAEAISCPLKLSAPFSHCMKLMLGETYTARQQVHPQAPVHPGVSRMAHYFQQYLSEVICVTDGVLRSEWGFSILLPVSSARCTLQGTSYIETNCILPRICITCKKEAEDSDALV